VLRGSRQTFPITTHLRACMALSGGYVWTGTKGHARCRSAHEIEAATSHGNRLIWRNTWLGVKHKQKDVLSVVKFRVAKRGFLPISPG
jgi:hypothetical protein